MECFCCWIWVLYASSPLPVSAKAVPSPGMAAVGLPSRRLLGTGLKMEFNDKVIKLVLPVQSEATANLQLKPVSLTETTLPSAQSCK